MVAEALQLLAFVAFGIKISIAVTYTFELNIMSGLFIFIF